ncbi:MAG: hypothetical protein L0L90_12205 [Lactococcus lactis]|jgi:hypothetical protein|uniref:hypothetical protein n=1 Tax=Lactococcus lactis TaxID=1358 RepID=UPI00248002D7|nr:hypothetical protein [Lactococcus lactis]MDN6024307.1 hypothetical protein [Lactobacillus sp.]MDH8063919.1 hypothetical protein [Lactococcus lactis subsp. lactis]MDN6220845.1 hypothetical protein [Lactococcus lactis]MDN6279063.1 hypothetical protein [Lactococcus lactis]MDN6339434.1 hypothetical protein [Lactococcus lactis]
MTEISGKSLHEIYKEDARKYKESIKLTGNFDKREALKVTMPMEEFDKLEKLALSAHTDKLSVEKLQEQLNTAKKALTEISNHYLTDESYEGDADYREIAIDALAAIGGDDEN